MGTYIIQRLIHCFFVLLGVTFIVFSLLYLSGDPMSLIMPPDATPEQVEEAREQYGFNDPFHIQYLNFLKKLVVLDLGVSFRRKLPVIDLILKYFPNTILLASVSYAIAMLIAVPAGILAAIKKDTFFDFFISLFVLIGQAAPTYWTALILIIVFAVNLQWLPSGGFGIDSHIVLPAIVLILFSTSRIARMCRSSMLEVLNQDYIRTARSQGIKELLVNFKFAFKSAAIPVVTLIGLEFIFLLEGSFIAETIFSWPGVGLLVINAVYQRDYPLVQGTVIFITAIILFLNLAVDVLYTYLDPRIRYGNSSK